MTVRLQNSQKWRQRLTIVALLLNFSLCLLASGASAGEVLLSAAGSGQWKVSSSGLNNIYAVDLQLSYESNRLSDLIVSPGAGLSGAMTAINDKVPGVIRFGVVSSQPLPQSGILLNLQSTGPEAELLVGSFTVKTFGVDGKVVPTTVRRELPIPTSSPPAPTETVTTSIPNQPSTVTPRRSGAAYGAAPLQSPTTGAERISPPSLPLSDSDPKRFTASSSNIATAPPAFSGPEKRFHSQEEIVTAIGRLPQPWTVSAIKAIFLKKPATASQVRQIPPVVLADGTSRVSLYLPKSLSQKIPTVGVQGCTLGTIWDAKEQGWEVELITRKEIWPAKALLLGEGDLIQFPIVIVPALVITPPISDNIAISNADFDGNGAITALEAYLYVGNLLAQR